MLEVLEHPVSPRVAELPRLSCLAALSWVGGWCLLPAPVWPFSMPLCWEIPSPLSLHRETLVFPLRALVLHKEAIFFPLHSLYLLQAITLWPLQSSEC